MSGERRDTDPVATLGRAATRATYHLLRAGVEGLKAIQAVLDEFGRMNDPEDDGPTPPKRVRIDLE